MQPRYAARTVLLDSDNQVAIICANHASYYKIPGGGIDPGEDLLSAAQRETREESGCDCQIITKLGQLTTDLPAWEMQDISIGFLAKVVGTKATPTFDAFEAKRGFTLQWLPNLTTAIQLLSSHQVSDPSATAIQARDLKFLQLAAEYLQNS